MTFVCASERDTRIVFRRCFVVVVVSANERIWNRGGKNGSYGIPCCMHECAEMQELICRMNLPKMLETNQIEYGERGVDCR